MTGFTLRLLLDKLGKAIEDLCELKTAGSSTTFNLLGDSDGIGDYINCLVNKDVLATLTRALFRLFCPH